MSIHCIVSVYADNLSLCEDICRAIEAKEPYDKLVAELEKLQSLENKGSISVGVVDELNNVTGHPLGIEAIGRFYWNRINPLLEEAYGVLDSETLNAPFLKR